MAVLIAIKPDGTRIQVAGYHGGRVEMHAYPPGVNEHTSMESLDIEDDIDQFYHFVQMRFPNAEIYVLPDMTVDIPRRMML